MTRLACLALAGSLLALGCSAPTAPLAQCTGDARACGAQAEFELRCEEGFWVPNLCEDGERCVDDRCAPYVCVAGESECRGNAVALCADGGWADPLPCATGHACSDGECLPVLCQPDSGRCGDDGSVERCNASGTAWESRAPCGDGEECLEGACLPASCVEGERACGPGSTVYTCGGNQGWTTSECEDGRPCVFGRCVECLSNETCAVGERCDEGECVETSPAWLTQSLSSATVGIAYSEPLRVEGGLPPLTFEVTEGALPAGLSLTSSGTISGTPTEPGIFPFTMAVADSRNRGAEAEFAIEVLAQGELRITTTQLAEADLDYSYSFQLQAAGGVPPLAWQALQPLPAGLQMTSTGRIHGTPTELGEFPLTFRVLDIRTPPAYAAKDFTLRVRVAPLEIIGDQTIDLLLTKIITLPLLVPYLPYSEQLQARGGLRPHEWSEADPPPGLSFLISNWGLPSGLSLGTNGRISGSATDLSDATKVEIPFSGISLTGYFIHVRVKDSQQRPDEDTAIFFIPTVPLQ